MPSLSIGPAPVAAFPGAPRPRLVLGALCWVLSCGFFVVEAIVRSAWTTPYSAVENYISDLGATTCDTITIKAYEAYVCSPLHPLMNGAYITVGALAILGAILIRPALPRRKLATVGLVLVSIAGIGAIVAGWFPEDVNIDVHLLGALLAVPGSNIGMGLLAAALWRGNRGLAVFTALAVCVGLTGLVLVGAAGAGIGIGLAERLAGYPFEIFKTVVAAVALAAWFRGRQSDGRGRTSPLS